MSIERLKRLLTERESEASVETLSDAFVDTFKGVTGMMKELRLLYDNPNISKAEQVKILLAGIELVKSATAKKQAKDPLAEMSDKELLDAFKEVNEQLSR